MLTTSPKNSSWIGVFNPDKCWIEIETQFRGPWAGKNPDLPNRGYAIGVAYCRPDGDGRDSKMQLAAPELLYLLNQAAVQLVALKNSARISKIQKYNIDTTLNEISTTLSNYGL